MSVSTEVTESIEQVEDVTQVSKCRSLSLKGAVSGDFSSERNLYRGSKSLADLLVREDGQIYLTRLMCTNSNI